MLAEMFGMEWYKVHDEAERLEHAVSPDFEAKLLAKLGGGGACPHGNLSELESPASRRRRGLLLMSEAEAGRHYVVSGIYERDRQMLEFLEARGIRPGVRVRRRRTQLRPDALDPDACRAGRTGQVAGRENLAIPGTVVPANPSLINYS